MRGLFLKIFAIFWLAQSLIFVISTALIVSQRFPGPGILSEALDSNLQHNAALAFHDFEAGGCPSFASNETRLEPSGAALLSPTGQLVCSTPNAPSTTGIIPHFPDRVDGRQLDERYVWLVPVFSSTGARYEYVWFQPPSHRPQNRWNFLHFAFPQLPVAILVGGLTTFVLVLLFTRPLVRLRKAARELAGGNLSARVPEASAAA